jgi:hypothetical protein
MGAIIECFGLLDNQTMLSRKYTPCEFLIIYPTCSTPKASLNFYFPPGLGGIERSSLEPDSRTDKCSLINMRNGEGAKER